MQDDVELELLVLVEASIRQGVQIKLGFPFITFSHLLLALSFVNFVYQVAL